jgi:hypothetical protein
MFAADPCFTTMVPGAWQNDRLGVNTPRGVLGGMVATLSGGDMTVNIASDSTTCDYIFYNDAAGAPFENAPAVASGKIALLPINTGPGDIALVDVYETHNETGGASIMLDYTVNALLYSSSRGLVTNGTCTPHSTEVIGKVVKVPTTSDPKLGIKLV